MINNSSTQSNRRDFIAKSLSSCAFCFIAAPMFASPNSKTEIDSNQEHKFDSDFGKTYNQAFGFAYKQWYIPAMKNLMKQIGKDEFLDMLKKSSEMIQMNNYKNLSSEKRTLTYLAELVKDQYGTYPGLTLDMVNENENTLEFTYTECLWAKTFREANAEDIGYAGFCFQDYQLCRSFNPKFKLIRTKTLMEGHDCCNFKVVKEA